MAEQMSEYVEENIEKIVSLEDICKAFHYSKNYIIRIFNKEFGISPVQYINEVKLRRAMYLLETTSKPIGEIATRCGYADYAYFYAVSMPDIHISILSLVRRCSCIVTFAFGVWYFRDLNIRRKVIALALILAGVAILALTD